MFWPLTLHTMTVLAITCSALAISSIPLWITSKILNIENSSIGRALIATLSGGLLATTIFLVSLPLAPFNLIFSFISYLWTIRIIYNVSWGKTFVLLIVSVLIAALITHVILLFLAITPHFMM